MACSNCNPFSLCQECRTEAMNRINNKLNPPVNGKRPRPDIGVKRKAYMLSEQPYKCCEYRECGKVLPTIRNASQLYCDTSCRRAESRRVARELQLANREKIDLMIKKIKLLNLPTEQERSIINECAEFLLSLKPKV